jgi:hypothetical protein
LDPKSDLTPRLTDQLTVDQNASFTLTWIWPVVGSSSYNQWEPVTRERWLVTPSVLVMS